MTDDALCHVAGESRRPNFYLRLNAVCEVKRTINKEEVSYGRSESKDFLFQSVRD